MKKLLPMVMLSLAGLLTLVSCGESSSNRLYAISYNLADPNMSSLWKTGLEDASVAAGYEKIKLEDAKNDDATAIQMVEAAVIDDYAAYLINVVSDVNGAKYLKPIKDSGKPCIFWNREVKADVTKSYEKAYYVGIESAEGGRYQGQLAAQHINKEGFSEFDRNGDGKLGVVVVRGEKGHPDAEARTLYSPIYLEKNLTGGNKDATATVEDVNYKATGFKKVEVHAIVDGTDSSTGAGWDAATAQTEVDRVINADTDKEIDLILSNNDGMALGICKGEKFKTAGIPIWGVDALDDAITELKKDGTQFMGTIKNDGKAQAKVCVDAAKNLIEGKAVDAGMTVVKTKAEWEANPKAIWNDTENKALRVHHAMITKANA